MMSSTFHNSFLAKKMPFFTETTHSNFALDGKLLPNPKKRMSDFN